MFKEPLNSTACLFINIVGFQLGWVIAVVFGDNLAILFTISYLFVHHLFLVVDNREWLLVGSIVVIGSVIDSVLTRTGVLVFDASNLFIPIWLVSLWALFATTIVHALRWFRSNLLLASVVGAIAGPFSYVMGARLSTTDIGQPIWLSLTVLVIVWAVIFPAMVMGGRLIDDKIKI